MPNCKSMSVKAFVRSLENPTEFETTGDDHRDLRKIYADNAAKKAQKCDLNYPPNELNELARQKFDNALIDATLDKMRRAANKNGGGRRRKGRRRRKTRRKRRKRRKRRTRRKRRRTRRRRRRRR